MSLRQPRDTDPSPTWISARPRPEEPSELAQIDPKASTGPSLEALENIADDSAVETWLKTIRNPQTKRAYLKDALEFGAFAGITKDDDLQIRAAPGRD